MTVTSQTRPGEETCNYTAWVSCSSSTAIALGHCRHFITTTGSDLRDHLGRERDLLLWWGIKFGWRLWIVR